MNRRTILRIAAVSCGALFVPAVTSRAESDPNYFDAVNKLIKWFKDLDDNFEQWVDKEKRAQFLRRVERVSKSLYALENDKRALVSSLTVVTPDFDRIKDNFADLAASIERLCKSLGMIGAQLRQDQKFRGDEIEAAVREALQFRSDMLADIKFRVFRLDGTPNPAYNRDIVKHEGQEAIKRLAIAGKAVASFLGKLEAMP